MDEISLTTTQRKEGKFLVVMRGIPGSGKSYEARQVAKRFGVDPNQHIFSTDDYWVKDFRESKTGQEIDPAEELAEYRRNWTIDLIGNAHTWNQRRAADAIANKVSPVIIDNTNIKARDIRFYVETAEKAGYTIVIQEPTSQWWKDHSLMLNDKQKNGKALEDFARFLAGFHQGMEAKYGAKGNTHGVPLETLRGMIRRWQPNLTIDDIMGRSDRRD